MSARDKMQIERIQQELLFVEKSLRGVDKKRFLQDDILQHAISMSLVTIGECANHLSVFFREQHPDIKWVEIIAVRNIVAHGYWQLNMEQIWQALITEVPQLKAFFDEM